MVSCTNLAARPCVVFSSADKAYPSACLPNRSSRVINSHRPSRRHTSSGSMSLFLSSSAGTSSRLAFARSSLVTRRAVVSRLYASHQSIGFFSHSRLPKAIAAALSNPSSVSWLWNLTLSYLFLSSWAIDKELFPLFLSSLVLRQESLRRSSQHLLAIVLRARAAPSPPPRKKNIVGGWRQSTQSVCQSARGGDQSTQA